MCIHIYTLHAACSHTQFQNIFHCRAARALPGPGHPTHGLSLAYTVHLPARPPAGGDAQHPLCDQGPKRVTRPVDGWCRACKVARRREEERRREGAGKGE